MVYSYDINHLAFVNRLDSCKTISLGDYQLHHDFMYDKHTNKILYQQQKLPLKTVLYATSGQVKLLLIQKMFFKIKNILGPNYLELRILNSSFRR